MFAARQRFSQGLDRWGETAVRRGVHPKWFGYRWMKEETIPQYFTRRAANAPETFEIVHPETVERNALPLNVSSIDELPDDRGWWGYSMRDVPARVSGETFVATLSDCCVVPYVDEADEFWVGVLNARGKAVKLREFHFREGHARVLRGARSRVRLEKATWVTERVYHNYSHWFTAHLPKLLLLRSRDALGDVLLPEQRPGFVDASLRMAGIELERFRTFDARAVLQIDALTLLGTDRFRPELLRQVRDAMPRLAEQPPHRRVFVSRAAASRRRLTNEDDVWAILERAGFERVRMESLSFADQVRLMQETAVLVAPHGAGLTNILFCAPGTHVVELADFGFPNPNFYAVGAAMSHHYWLLAARADPDAHPVHRDLWMNPERIETLLAALEARADSAAR
jgi:capsular polysaccharide biosynthesis protein